MPIQIATLQDVNALVVLLDKAYRGDESKKGWTYEADLIEGDHRTDANAVSEIIARPGSVFMTFTDDNGKILGCVNLQKHEYGLHLGMFAVDPEIQARGIGKQLLAAADEHARQNAEPKIRMDVISVRSELIAWYERHGYVRTGESRPFVNESKFGVATQPLEFIALEKQIKI